MKKVIVSISAHPVNLQIFMQILKSKYKFIGFSSYLEAFQYFESGNRASLIILDTEMPMTTGFDLMLRLREISAVGITPVIFFSDSDDEESEVEAIQLGAADYLRMPINPVITLKRIDMHIEMAEYKRLEHCAKGDDL